MFSHNAEVEVLQMDLGGPVGLLTDPTIRRLSNSDDYRGVREEERPELPRAASYTNLPSLAESSPEPGLKRTFSENVLSLDSDHHSQGSNGHPLTPNTELLRRASSRKKEANLQETKPKIAISKFTLSSDQIADDTAYKPTDGDLPDRLGRPQKTSGRSVTGTIKSFARKSWISSSRSPSPSPQEQNKPETASNGSPIRTAPPLSRSAVASSIASSPLKAQNSVQPREESPPRDLPARRPNLLSRNSGRRPLSALIPRSKTESDVSLPKSPSLQSLQSLRSRSSMEKLQASTISRMPSVKVPPLPPSISNDKFPALATDPSKKRDELWSVFRSLESDYAKFQSKSSSFKANVIRSCLLPFLSRYANHPSNNSLRPEDLDRRINILNKWWTGLLESLNGRNNQSVSGTDRPAFLEGVTGIMTRAEWKLPPFASGSPTDTPQRRALKSTSKTSIESSGSDFLLESIYHNVRNIFVQNLLSQMAFVVDKMSMRNAPASLVAFCGKACAYAFFYCPGVADVLVRLWNIPAETLRRILTEFGVTRGQNMAAITREVASHFPPGLRKLAVTSHVALMRSLRHVAPLPMGGQYIRWYGPWISRWSGRDSDLFFVFAKHFHILVAEFLPEDLDKRSRVCVPGLALVHAQILTVLEQTLYRQAGHQPMNDFTSTPTFDDLEGADATAAALPLTSANAQRSMAENRLIILLRDLLAETNPDYDKTRQLYAESFGDILKAAAHKTSLFDHNACFVLCDFMEEVLAIMFRYQQSTLTSDLLDWPFWLQVCQKMMESHNSLTEVRLFAFVYSSWNILISNEDRKRDLCLSWLLEDGFFDEHFNHWCPMVRSYFHRLLCWRVARFDGVESELDCQIFEKLLERLHRNWAHYQYLKEEAEQNDLPYPSTAPCSPAPGRRLIIIRNDSSSAASLFVSFDRLNLPNSNQSTPYNSHSSLLNSVPPADSPTNGKRRWSLLGKINPFTSTPGNTRPGEVTPPSSSDDTKAAEASDGSPSGKGLDKPISRPTTPPHQAFSFKFSLEWLDRPSWPSKNKRLSCPKLPLPAHEYLQSRQGDTAEVQPKKPQGWEVSGSKYAGRALAEWAQIVAECQNFFDRRKDEGVPNNRLVETPTLSVESFRIHG